MSDSIIVAENVHKRYRRGGEEVWALRGVSLAVERGEFLSIMGPSGSGKSTLFNQIGALDKPSEGRVLFEGFSLFDLSEPQQAWFRCQKLGYVFQTYNLVPVMSALENVALPLVFAGKSEAEATERARSVLERVGLGHRLHHHPSELSGGQQQRVAIARALANHPTVVLADEPTGNLDTKTGAEVVELLSELNRSEGVTVVFSTHDPKMRKSSTRICYIKDGQVERVTAAPA
jgi:putative ABC transport system ATP-binding protein